MSTYKIATGHNVALLSLTAISPQPASEGLKFARTTYAASGGVYPEAPYIELVWAILPTPTLYAALLTQFGLSASTAFANVTVYIPNAAYSYARYNGVAVRPATSRRGFFIREIAIVVKDLAAL